MASRGIARGVLLLVTLLACVPSARAWAPKHYRVTFYANKNPVLRTWLELGGVSFYAGAEKQSVASVTTDRGSVHSGVMDSLVDDLRSTFVQFYHPASGWLTTLTFTLAEPAWCDSYIVQRSSGTTYDRDPKMFAVSASADGSTYYPLMFVRDAAIGEQDDGKRFYFPTVPIDVYELEIFSARDGGDVVEFAEFQLVNAQGERIGDGAVGFGDDTDSDTSANAESLAYMEPTYVYPWQGADGDPSTVVRGSLSGAGGGGPPRALSVAVERHASDASYVPVDVKLVTGGDENLDPASWRITRIDDVSASGSATRSVLVERTDYDLPTTRFEAFTIPACANPSANAFDAAYDDGAGGCVARCYEGYQKVHEATSLRPAACEAIDGEIECACAKTRMRELGFHVS